MNRRNMLPQLVTFSGFLTVISCVQFDAEVPSACFLQEDVAISLDSIPQLNFVDGEEVAEGAGLLFPDGVPVSVQKSFVRDGLDSIPELFDDMGVEGNIYLTQVLVIAQEGLSDFSILERISLTVRSVDSESTLPFLELAVCDRNIDCDTSQPFVELAGSPNQNLLDYLREGTLEFGLELKGALPLRAWSFDVDVCLRGAASYTLGL
ncbi:MAG: hypothetical protein KTR25_07930 [Myxococcales bacterium]|nr:hypothetical protein [Myxococcales bacterium]